jgi:mRNA-degrading endonuclease RelE of RelBE toxin-antitoxin system
LPAQEEKILDCSFKCVEVNYLRELVFRVVIHRKVTQELKRLKKAHLKNFGENLVNFLKRSKRIQFLDVKKIEGEENFIALGISE